MLEIKNVSPFCIIGSGLTVEGVKALFVDNSVDVEISENDSFAIVQPKTEIVSFKCSTSDNLSFEYSGPAINSGSSGVASMPRSAFSGVLYYEHL